jgi:uncharacterized protein with beta-barrel porin domain
VLDASLLSNSDCGNTQTSSLPQGAPTQNVTACKAGLWVQATGDSLQIDGTPGLRSTAFGLLGGFEAAVTDDLHVGVEAGAGRLNGNDAQGGTGSIDSAQAGLYAFGQLGPLMLSATVDGAHDDYQVNRNTGIGHSVARPDGNTYAGGVQIAWPIQAGNWNLAPKFGALYQHQQLDGFDETLASSNPLAPAYAVTGAHSTYTTLQPYLGVDFASRFQAGGITYVPQLSAGYRYDARNSPPAIVLTTQDGTLFDEMGNTEGRGMATVGARITAQAGASWKVYVDYNGAFSSHLHDNALTFGFSKQF